MSPKMIGRMVFIWIFCILSAVATTSYAGSGTNGADFLRIPVFSRGAALSGAMVANADGVNALFYNPAGIAQHATGEFTFSHTELLQDLRLENLSVALPISGRTGIGASATYLGYGEIAGYDIDGMPTGSLSAYSFMLSVGVSQKLNDVLSLGLVAKPVYERLDALSATTIAFDMGVMADFGNLSVGAQYANFGGKLKYVNESVSLPATLRVGASYQTLGMSTVSASLAREAGGALSVGGGLEYVYNSMLTFRVGYGGSLDEHVNSTDGLSFGLGMNISRLGLDYSFRPSSTSEGIHQVTGAYHFGR